MKIKIIFSFFIALVLGSCSLFQTEQKQDVQVEFLPGMMITLPQPAQLGMDMQVSQIVSAAYHDKDGKVSNFSTQVEIVVKPDDMTMVALSGWGGSLFKLNYDGEAIQSSSLPMPNQNIGVKQSLTEFIISNAPADVVRQMFAGTGIQLIVNKDGRVLEDKDGNKVMTIEYKGDKPWTGNILIHNYHYDYTVKVQNLSFKTN